MGHSIGSVPNRTVSPNGGGENQSEWCLGMILQITTTLGETFSGEIFAYDEELSLLVLSKY